MSKYLSKTESSSGSNGVMSESIGASNAVEGKKRIRPPGAFVAFKWGKRGNLKICNRTWRKEMECQLCHRKGGDFGPEEVQYTRCRILFVAAEIGRNVLINQVSGRGESFGHIF